MKVLVTGGVGFIGTNLVKRLHEDGHKVFVIDDYSVGKPENEVMGVDYFDLDINEIDELPHFGISLCYHLAAWSRIQPSFEKPHLFFERNVNGTHSVLEWANNYDVKVVYAGSSSRWHDPMKSPYALYKKIGEDICKLYRINKWVDVEIARFYNVYGQYEITNGEWAAVIGKWIGQIIKGDPITIVGDGEQRRDFTHVNDIIEGLINIGFSDEKHEDAWELGTGFNYSINEVADMFVNKFGCEVEYVKQQSGNYEETKRVNNDAVDRLGWLPKDVLKDYINNLKIK